MKQVILMGVNDQELVQELISIIPTQELDTVVQHCYEHEAARHTATAITSPTKTVCATSQYKKDKKAKQQSPKPLQNPNMAGICNNCGRSHGKANCPAADWTCSNCGKKGHRARAPRCPANNVTCNQCGKQGHYGKCCRSTTGGNKSTVHTTKDKNSGVWRVKDSICEPSETTPCVVVKVMHDRGAGILSMLPDTGADTTIMGPDHLHTIGLTYDHLHTPQQKPTYTADGSPMQPAIGSVQVQLEIKGSITHEWIDIHPGTPIPLLSYRACRELALIPKRFPHPITQVTHARIRSGQGEQTRNVDEAGGVAVAIRAVHSLVQLFHVGFKEPHNNKAIFMNNKVLN
ncbi:hypothetical protein Pcinc_014610 [Petrolisthes cinctipes]|uniref:CCHC-type domain-containing protein n=1 Tax=Petrolisthes cinctipes TaxID=88211 RepID=A0AAE1KT38_PETCI|nr:hypothetical protein Pcinc_014610 [Petrolisthes cinctipes]